MNFRHYDFIDVEVDGENKAVYNWCNVKQPAVVRGSGEVEKFEPVIGRGDCTKTPEAVTHWLAEELRLNFDIEPEQLGIDVIDVTEEEVNIV